MKKLKYIKCFFLLIVLCFFSCNIISFEELEVNCNLPETISFFEDDYIIINFSIVPNYYSVESNLNLQIDGKNVKTEKIWMNNCCYIKPTEGWTYGKDYAFSISSNAIQMADGRTYSISLFRSFHYGSVAKKLQLVSCSIPQDSIVNSDTPLIFSFNYPVDISSFEKYFVITPSIKKQINYSNENTTVSITPLENWETNKVYSWKISDVKSKNNYPMEKELSGSFYAPIDTIQPVIVNVNPVICNNSLKTWMSDKELSEMNITNSIGISFSEPIDFDSLNDAISFNPSIQGYLIQYDEAGKGFVWCIERNWEPETEYQLKISTSLVDRNKQPLKEDYIKHFTPAINYISVDSICIGTNTITDYSENVNICQMPQNDINIKINFNKGIDNSYKDKAYQIVSVKSFFPSTAASPSIISASWDTDYCLNIKYKGFTKSTSINNYYLLKISGGNKNILDEQGGFIKNDLCVYFIVQ